jgi:SPX domain protein involved in polyphosphate accumulation
MSSPLPLLELFPLLTPIEKSFFTALDVELNKVESFYLDREQELLVRTGMLEQQLEELVEHRKLFDVSRFNLPSLQ